MTRWRTRHRGSRDDRGAAAVEFAIVFVVLIFIIFSIIDFGRLLFAVQGMKSASREGARTAIIATATSDQVLTSIESAGDGPASIAGDSGVASSWRLNWDPSTAWDGTAINAGVDTICKGNKGQAVTVHTQVNFTWFTPTMPLLGNVVGAANVPTVEATTTMRCE